MRGVRQVDRNRNVPTVPRELRRSVRETSAGVPDTVDAKTVDREKADLTELPWPGHVVHADAGARRIANLVRIALVVHEEQPVRELRLVSVGVTGNSGLGHDARNCRIGDVDHARAHREVAHVADVEHILAPHDLHAVAVSVEIAVSDELEAARFEHLGSVAHAPSIRGAGRSSGHRAYVRR